MRGVGWMVVGFFAGVASPVSAQPAPSSPEKPARGPTPRRGALRSWVDSAGVLHFSNVRPKSQGRRLRVSTQVDDGFGGTPSLVITSIGEPKASERYNHLFEEAAVAYRLPALYLKAIARVESNFNPLAVSSAQAKGLMQLIDSTAESMEVDDPFDPRQSVMGGARYLRLLADEFDGNLVKMTAAYNAGPHRVRRANGVPAITETKRYVRRVLEVYQGYLKEGS